MKRTISLEPEYREAYYYIGMMLQTPIYFANAIPFLLRELKMRGRTVRLLLMTASAHTARAEYGRAEEYCKEALALEPDSANALSTLGTAYLGLGDAPQAVQHFQQCINADSLDYGSYTSFLFSSNYLAGLSRDEMFARHTKWAATIQARYAPNTYPTPVGDEKLRRLRIGYISPDFQSHPVGNLISSIIQRHDKDENEIFCYSDAIITDHVTEIIRNSVDHWRDVVLLDVNALVEQVRGDQIDILVDLAGHTRNGRLQVFAMRAAPIQVSWLGYFHSTGMDRIDYFISDPYTSPAGSGQLFSETMVHLPQTRFCYTAPPYISEVQDAPHAEKGFVTFGCFNNILKISDEVIAVWSQILTRMPDTQLLLKADGLHEEKVCERLLAKFAEQGIGANRVELRRRTSHDSMFREYGDVDIALDPFPFTGGMTTFEALYMGVPVVTLAGDTVVSRQSASILMNLDLPEFIHETVESYIDGAIALASESAKLIELRSVLRERINASPLSDTVTFTRNLEQLYRRMWLAYCDGHKLPGDL
jgi:predicted O-linked N-acetylglucosamine transferase (SPINDLY family)